MKTNILRSAVSLGCLAFILSLWSGWPAVAEQWRSLWHNSDQRGVRAFAAEDYVAAAETFEDAAWRAAANHRRGNYRTVLADLATLDDAVSLYNRGNALARLYRLEEAITSYKEVLILWPSHEDARHNLRIVEQLLLERLPGQQQALIDPDREPGEETEGELRAENEAPPPPPNAESGEENREDTSQRTSDRESQDADNNTGNSTLQDPETAEEQEFSMAVEDELSVQQWLGRIRDEPGTLLKNKFRLQREEDNGARDAPYPVARPW